MKKFFAILTLATIAQMSFAQYEAPSKQEIDYLQKTAEKNQLATKDVKKNVKASTWIKYGKSLCNLYEASTAATLMGNAKEFVLKYLDVDAPKEFENVEIAGTTYAKGVANKCEYYFSSNKYIFYTYRDDSVLANALEAFQKAYTLDQGKGTTEDVVAGLKKLGQYYTYEGANAHRLNKFAYSGEIFEKIVDFTAAAPVNEADTVALANACISYYRASDYESTVRMCKKCMDAGYYGEDFVVLQYLSLSYSAMGKDAEAKAILEECYSKHPESKNIVFLLIDTYTRLGENPEKLLVLLDDAIAKAPQIENLYCIKGGVCEKLGKYEDALAEYKKAEALNSPDARGLACEGQMYYNLAVKTDSEASQLDYKEVQKYDELKAKTYEYLKQAGEAFEACYEKSGDEGLKASVASCLKSVFFYLRNQGDEYQTKLEKYTKIVEAGK